MWGKADGIERFEIEQAISAAEDSKLVAVTDILKTEVGRDPQRAARALEAILAGASPDVAESVNQSADAQLVLNGPVVSVPAGRVNASNPSSRRSARGPPSSSSG